MKTCIIGSARSGTTSLYHLISNIQRDGYKGNIEYVYEPFLWNKEVSKENGSLNGVRFRYNDSISYEGIYNHIKIPLFIQDSNEFKNNHFLNKTFRTEASDANLSLKLIRANGRIQLLKEICPDCKFIFIIRNPLDSINSIRSKFSFYGGEFYTDDYNRFAKEVKSIYGEDLIAQEQDKFNKDLSYWYFMNEFALSSIEKYKNNSLVICYEEWKRNPKETVINICNFLQIPYKEKYIKSSDKIVGPITNTFEISEKEISIIKKYLDKYINLLDKYEIPNTINTNNILKKYQIVNKVENIEDVYYGMNAYAMMKMHLIPLLNKKNKPPKLETIDNGLFAKLYNKIKNILHIK